MDKQQEDAADHLRMMDLRIEMQTEKIARLRQAGADISQAARTLKLLQDTKKEMAVQIALLRPPAPPRGLPF
jgi:prefoldin subunit 5